MPSVSPRLSLPFIAPAQAQKHVTHNEAISLLDVLAQLNVLAFDAQTPPASPAEGNTYALGSAPAGDWAGQANRIAAFSNGAWVFLSPRAGWYAGMGATGELFVYDGAQWQSASGQTQNIAGIGIGTSWDTDNRLAVSANATLLNHAGNDHRVKVNKDTAGDTASLLFQSGFSGRAEMGLAGSDDFSVKVSGDGGTWNTALTAEAATGHVTVPLLTSGHIDVPADGVASLPTPATSGCVLVTVVGTGSAQNNHSGLLSYDAGASPSLVDLAGAPRLVNLAAQTLTGTTGVAGDTSVAAATGALQIENRTAGVQRYSYLFLCGA